MAFADFSVPSTVRRCQVLEADGIFSQTIAAANVYAGSLVSKTGILATSSAAGVPAVSVALEDCYPSTSGTIQCALYAILEPGLTKSTNAPSTYTRTTHGGTAGQVLYLDNTAGTCSTQSSHTNLQVVGHVLNTNQIVISPTTLSTTYGDNIGDGLVTAGDVRINDAVTMASGFRVNSTMFTCSSAGNVAIAGTLTVTGAPTIAGTVAANGGVQVGTEANVTLTATDLAATSTAVATCGYLTISGDAADVTGTLANTPRAGEWLIVVDLANSANDKAHKLVTSTGTYMITTELATGQTWTSSGERDFVWLFGLSTVYWMMVGCASTAGTHFA